jgi:ketosteroid isomerase-like protein
MKKQVIVGCIAVMLLAQQGLGADQTREKDHESLRALRGKMETAINAGDIVQLKTCLAKEFTVIMPDQEAIKTPDALTAYWDKMFKKKSSPVTSMKSKFTADVLTQFTGPETGYCYGSSCDVYTLKNERKIAMESSWSALLVKEDGTWKIQLAHVGVNFLDNPVLEAKSMSWFGRLLVGLHLRKLPGEVKE